MSPERVSVGEVGKGHSMLMDQKQKRRGTNSEESGARNLEAESIRTGAESMGGREVTAKLHDALCTLRTWLRIKL